MSVQLSRETIFSENVQNNVLEKGAMKYAIFLFI